MVIESSSLSKGWTEAFLATYDGGEIAPLEVTISGFAGAPPEDLATRDTVDDVLRTGSGTWKVSTSASTIFPGSMWRPGTSRESLYERYLRIYEGRIKNIRANRRGTYFQRLISYGPEGINQLEHVIGTWNRGVTRRSAFVASILDPRVDHVPTPYLGFPCLHQVCFAGDGSAGMSVTGFYAKQDIMDRGYGNYLGLAWLGGFVADAVGRQLTRVTCIASVAGLSNRFNKGDLSSLANGLRTP